MNVRPGPGPLCGAVLFVVGMVIYLWATRMLATAVPSVAAAPSVLLTRGHYRIVRNPLYLACAAMFAGVSMLYTPWHLRDLVIIATVITGARPLIVVSQTLEAASYD
jgi:protein-S-isoprenylcysteine O-methyltransferase Ste14